jgi:cupin fold WbuC family metalloprotein
MSPAATAPRVTVVEHDGRVLARILRAYHDVAETTFVTDTSESLQLGLVARDTGGEVLPHRHLAVPREIVGTAEILVLQKGRCELTLFTDEGELVATHELATGDVVALLAGGHGLKMLEPTLMLEVKQGPYLGPSEKEHFDT